MNANKLREKIIEKGLTVSKTAELLGIHRSSLYRKMTGHEKVSVNDAVLLKQVLGLTNLEALDIFLSRND